MQRTTPIGKRLGGAIRLGTVAAALALAAAGCSAMATPVDPPPAAHAQSASAKPATPPPNVIDCGIVSIGSPSKYACNGKVYTAREITQMRADWAKRQTATN